MTGFLAPWYFQQFRDDAGRPLANGYISTFVVESDIPKPLYYDINCENPCPNPLPLDAAGYAPEFFLTSGAYTFAIYDRNGIQITRREPVIGAIAAGYGDVDTYKVMALSGDDEPGYLINKLQNSTSLTWSTSGNKIVATVTSAGSDTYQVKATSGDSNPDFLDAKIADTDTISLMIDGDKLKADYIGPNYTGVTSSDTNPSYLFDKFIDSESVNFDVAEIDGRQYISATAINDGRVKVTSSDNAGYLGDKIFGGTGIVLSEVEDVDGKKIYISTTSNVKSVGKVQVTSAGSLGYLGDKIEAGTSINVSVIGDKLRISSNPLLITSALPFTSAVTVTSTPAIGLIAITLSAGLWEVTGGCNGYIQPTSGLTTPGINVNINDSITIPFDGWEAFAHMPDNDNARTLSVTISPKQYNITTSKTVYLVAQCRFGNYAFCYFWGNLVARKIG